MKKLNCFGLVAATVFVGSLAANLPAQAQANAMKVCGDKWQAAKAANTTNNQTWQQFLSACRKDMAANPAPAAAPAAPAPTAAAPAPRAPTASAAAPAPRTTAPASAAVFPTAVSPQYSTLSAGKQRQKTCVDQYNANKANNANGGLNWIQKGGGYWSQCNARLKGQG